MLKKLGHSGFRYTNNKWLENYLNVREQFVSVLGVNFDRKKMSLGFHRGPSLVPSFSFYFQCNILLILLFADDTTFQMSGENLHDLFQNTTLELEKASTWLKANKLTLNVDKSKYLVFSERNGFSSII